MPNNAVTVNPAQTGHPVRTSQLTETSGPFSGQLVDQENVIIADPTNPANQAAVTQLHSGFNQPIPTGGSLLGAGVAQVQNASTKLDPSIEGGQDGVPARGLPATVTSLAARSGSTSCGQTVSASASSVNLLVASSAGFIPGCIAIIDTVASGVQEGQVVIAVPDTTHITVDHLNNAHAGGVSAFPIITYVYNQERDAAGELDVAAGIGAATAIEYEFDGVTYLRGRNVFGVSGVYTDTSSGSVTASSLPVVITVQGGFTAGPTGLQVGHTLVIDPLGGSPEQQQIIALNAGAKTITVAQLFFSHSGNFKVFAAVQSLSAAPQNLTGIGVAAEAAMLYSGQNGSTGVQQFSVEKDVNAVGTNLPISVSVGTAGASGIDADCEFGVVDTSARSFAAGTLIPDQHGQGGEDLVTVGGRLTTSTTPTALTVVKAGAGRLCRILVVTTNGANPILIYDNSSAASGTVVGVVAANAAAGTILDLQMPCTNGITIAATASAGTITVSYY